MCLASILRLKFYQLSCDIKEHQQLEVKSKKIHSALDLQVELWQPPNVQISKEHQTKLLHKLNSSKKYVE